MVDAKKLRSYILIVLLLVLILPAAPRGRLAASPEGGTTTGPRISSACQMAPGIAYSLGTAAFAAGLFGAAPIAVTLGLSAILVEGYNLIRC